MTWCDKPTARRHWREAPADDALLDELLEAAHFEVARFAPAPALDDLGAPIIPTAWKIAEAYQAREVREAASRQGGTIPGEVYAIRPRPLTDEVKQLLRPRRGRRAIG